MAASPLIESPGVTGSSSSTRDALGFPWPRLTVLRPSAERTTPNAGAGGRRLSLASRRSRRRSSFASGLDLTGGLLRDDDEEGTADLPVCAGARASSHSGHMRALNMCWVRNCRSITIHLV